MAGRYVILAFDDREAAEAFTQNKHLPKQLGYSLMAMFLKPLKFCECPGKRDLKDWAKGKRTGLYICRKCKKPSPHHEWGLKSRLQYVFGFNQLED